MQLPAGSFAFGEGSNEVSCEVMKLALAGFCLAVFTATVSAVSIKRMSATRGI